MLSDVPAGPGVPAGSRRAGRAERTRSSLLDAARAAFGRLGWPGARVEDVCREAGVGHGTFYAYYGNKSEIVEALVRRHAVALDALVERPWTSADLRTDVRRVLTGVLALVENDRDIREIWSSASSTEPALAALGAEIRAQFVTRIGSQLDRAVDAGRARAGLDVAVAAPALAAMVEQTTGPLGPDVPADRLVEGLTDLWVHAVSA
ncbi:MAG: TetR/AcrR family transcriptional regulator [Actinomycetota bacterium]|nr:TetR/AcrR family transcriptional regulator [Actinomycetota bacterium]